MIADAVPAPASILMMTLSISIANFFQFIFIKFELFGLTLCYIIAFFDFFKWD